MGRMSGGHDPVAAVTPSNGSYHPWTISRLSEEPVSGRVVPPARLLRRDPATAGFPSYILLLSASNL